MTNYTSEIQLFVGKNMVEPPDRSGVYLSQIPVAGSSPQKAGFLVNNWSVILAEARADNDRSRVYLSQPRVQYGAKSIGTGSVLISQSLLLKISVWNCGWLDTVGPHGPCANTSYFIVLLAPYCISPPSPPQKHHGLSSHEPPSSIHCIISGYAETRVEVECTSRRRVKRLQCITWQRRSGSGFDVEGIGCGCGRCLGGGCKEGRGLVGMAD
jgi:hypothetical protein